MFWDQELEGIMIIIRNAQRHIIRRLKRRQLLQRRWQQPVPIRLSLCQPAVVWVTDVVSRAAHPATPPAAKIFLRPNLRTALALVAVLTTIVVCPMRPLVFPLSRWPSTLPPHPSRFDSASPSIQKNENAVSSDSAENIVKPSKAKAHRFVQSNPCLLNMNFDWLNLNTLGNLVKNVHVHWPFSTIFESKVVSFLSFSLVFLRLVCITREIPLE